MEERKLNYEEAAEITGLPKGTLYSLVSRVRIPHIRLGKRLVRFSLLELGEWMEAHHVQASDHTKARGGK